MSTTTDTAPHSQQPLVPPRNESLDVPQNKNFSRQISTPTGDLSPAVPAEPIRPVRPKDVDVPDQLLIEEDDDTVDTIHSDNTQPIALMFASLIFPPCGMIAFLSNHKVPKNDTRYIWGRRALYFGSAVAVVYSMAVCVIVGEMSSG